MDGFSTGRYLAPRFRAKGVDVVHVWSGPVVPGFFAKDYQAGDYVADLGCVGDDPDGVRLLDRHVVSEVIAGTESGVETADRLNTLFGREPNASVGPGPAQQRRRGGAGPGLASGA